MIHHKVKLLSMAKLPVGPGGVVAPLCDSCINKECGNPVSLVSITIFGIEKKTRLHKSGGSLMAVANCEGYIHSNKDEYIDDNIFMDDIEDMDDI